MISGDPHIVGQVATVCLEGTIAGAGSPSFWTVDNTIVNTTDITNLTNPGNSDAVNWVEPLCDACVCLGRYTQVPQIAHMISTDLETTNFSALLVTMFTQNVNTESRVCHGFRNRFLAILTLRNVLNSSGGPLDIDVTLTSSLGRTRTSNVDIKTSKLLHNSCSVLSGCEIGQR